MICKNPFYEYLHQNSEAGKEKSSKMSLMKNEHIFKLSKRTNK